MPNDNPNGSRMVSHEYVRADLLDAHYLREHLEHRRDMAEQGRVVKRPITVDDYVEVIRSDAKRHIGQRGIVVRDNGPDYDTVCVVLPKLWDHGIWYSRNDLKKTYRKRGAK